MSERALSLVAGAGPGLGSALMQRFTNAGYHAVGLSRSASDKADILSCNLSDGEAAKATLEPVMERHGAPKLVVHNTAHLVIGALADTSQADFEDCWRAMALSAFNLSRAVMEPMAQAGWRNLHRFRRHGEPSRRRPVQRVRLGQIRVAGADPVVGARIPACRHPRRSRGPRRYYRHPRQPRTAFARPGQDDADG